MPDSFRHLNTSGYGLHVQIAEHHKRGNDERHEQHRADEQKQQLSVIGKDGQTACRYSRVNQTHDAKGRQVDYPANDLADGFRQRRS